jgi:hypothetical protein
VMVYLDRQKLQAKGITLDDVTDAVNATNQILPSGDAKIGPYEWYVYNNGQIPSPADLNQVPVMIGPAQAPIIIRAPAANAPAANLSNSLPRPGTLCGDKKAGDVRCVREDISRLTAASAAVPPIHSPHTVKKWLRATLSRSPTARNGSTLKPARTNANHEPHQPKSSTISPEMNSIIWVSHRANDLMRLDYR